MEAKRTEPRPRWHTGGHQHRRPLITRHAQPCSGHAKGPTGGQSGLSTWGRGADPWGKTGLLSKTLKPTIGSKRKARRLVRAFRRGATAEHLLAKTRAEAITVQYQKVGASVGRPLCEKAETPVDAPHLPMQRAGWRGVPFGTARSMVPRTVFQLFPQPAPTGAALRAVSLRPSPLL